MAKKAGKKSTGQRCSITLRISPEVRDELDKLAELMGLSRNQLIERVLTVSMWSLNDVADAEPDLFSRPLQRVDRAAERAGKAPLKPTPRKKAARKKAAKKGGR